MRLLLIEDEEVLGRATEQALLKKGFAVDWVRSGQDACAAVRANEYGTILLDLGLPGVPGAVILRELRARRSATPVIVLTARGQVEDRVSMLDLGADDYMVKPCNVTELCARIRAVERRASAGTNSTAVQKIGPLEFLQAARAVRWRGQPVTLTAREFDVLEMLVMQRPRVVARAQLEEALYGWGDEVESNAIEVHIHFLRRKFVPELIVTIRGRGYQIGSEESLLAQAPRADAAQP